MNENIKRISFSELKNWKECSHRHKLIYIEKKSHFSGNEYTAFGTAIHTACETKLLNPDVDVLQTFRENFSKEIDEIRASGTEVSSSLLEEMSTQAEKLCKEILPAIQSDASRRRMNAPSSASIGVQEISTFPQT